MPTEILTPVGRIVWGHPGKSQIKKNMRTKEVIMKNGVPVNQWVFGVAIPKADFNSVWQALYNEAAPHFPQGVPADFAWKFKDGDTGTDKQGRPMNTREGYPGHIVLSVSTEAFAPPIYKFENGAYRQIAPEEIKTGDYIAMKIIIAYNGNKAGDGAGVYINPKGIELVGHGPEIVSSGADPQEMFAGVNRTLPAGATLTPVSSAPAHAAYAPPVQPVYTPLHQPMPTALPAPATDFVQAAVGGGIPPMPGMPTGR